MLMDYINKLSRIFKGRRVVYDIEANSLTPDNIWCVVFRDIDTQEKFKFHPSTPLGKHSEWSEEAVKFFNTCGVFIGHNILGYDNFWVNKLLGLDIKVEQSVDTLVLSRLFRPVSPFTKSSETVLDNRIGGHGLEAWGRRLGYPKIDFHEFDRFSNQMLTYCERDVDLNYEVFLRLVNESKGFSEECIELEHWAAWYLSKQTRKGFYLDQEKAKVLMDSTAVEIEDALKNLQQIFPPLPKLVEANYKPKVKKDGTITAAAEKKLSRYSNEDGYAIQENEDGSYNLFVMREFNPGSSQQVVERLLNLGWVPTKFTPAGNPKADKETLPEAIDFLLDANPKLVELEHLKMYNILTDRNNKAAKWLELVEEDGRVHGKVNPIGAGTHRCSHYDDNMANIASVVNTDAPITDFPDLDFSKMDKFQRFDENKIFLSSDGEEVEFALTGKEGKYGWDSRECWAASRPDHVIVGADASGIQLRALAHYMNDPKYTKALLEEDIHVVHQHAAGLPTRKKAKTFIYAWLLGAGDLKIGSIVGVSEEDYEEIFAWARNYWIKNYYRRNSNKNNLLDFTMDRIRKQGMKATRHIVATSIKGFQVKEQFLERTPALKRLKTVDIPNATKQGFLVGLDGRKLWIPSEHLAMSMYLQGFEAVIMKQAMKIYHQTLEKLKVPFVQCAFVHDEFEVETPREYADIVGQAISDSFRQAGEDFKVNCPLEGEYLVGRSWAEVH